MRKQALPHTSGHLCLLCAVSHAATFAVNAALVQASDSCIYVIFVRYT